MATEGGVKGFKHSVPEPRTPMPFMTASNRGENRIRRIPNSRAVPLRSALGTALYEVHYTSLGGH